MEDHAYKGMPLQKKLYSPALDRHRRLLSLRTKVFVALPLPPCLLNFHKFLGGFCVLTSFLSSQEIAIFLISL